MRGAGGSGNSGGAGAGTAGTAGTSGTASSMRPRTSCGGIFRFGRPLLSRAGGRGAGAAGCGRGAGAGAGAGAGRCWGAGAGAGRKPDAGAGAASDGEGCSDGGEGAAGLFSRGRSRGASGRGGGCQEGAPASGVAPTEVGSGRSGWAQPARQKAARIAKMRVRCIENPPELKSATPRSLAADCESRTPTFV